MTVASAAERAVRHGLDEFATPFEARPSGPPQIAETAAIVAMIGFTGHIRGTLTLVTTESVIRAMNPPPVRELITSVAVACDVLGEHANLTLGRMKNELLRHSVELRMAVPTTLSGHHVEISRATESFSEWLSFRCPEGDLHVRVDADLSGCPAVSSVAAAEPMSEGELVLF